MSQNNKNQKPTNIAATANPAQQPIAASMTLESIQSMLQSGNFAPLQVQYAATMPQGMSSAMPQFVMQAPPQDQSGQQQAIPILMYAMPASGQAHGTPQQAFIMQPQAMVAPTSQPQNVTPLPIEAQQLLMGVRTARPEIVQANAADGTNGKSSQNRRIQKAMEKVDNKIDQILKDGKAMTANKPAAIKPAYEVKSKDSSSKKAQNKQQSVKEEVVENCDSADDCKDEEALKDDSIPKDVEEDIEQFPSDINGMKDLELLGFDVANYTSSDMALLTQVTAEMSRRMQIARGMKRGRKVQGFADYCQKTTEKINELKAELDDDCTQEERKKQLRNQISASQARLKQRITNMDQELRLEQKNQQLSTILNVVKSHVEPEQLSSILCKIDEAFKEMDLFNSPAFLEVFGKTKIGKEPKGRKKQQPKQKDGAQGPSTKDHFDDLDDDDEFDAAAL